MSQKGDRPLKSKLPKFTFLRRHPRKLNHDILGKKDKEFANIAEQKLQSCKKEPEVLQQPGLLKAIKNDSNVAEKR